MKTTKKAKSTIKEYIMHLKKRKSNNNIKDTKINNTKKNNNKTMSSYKLIIQRIFLLIYISLLSFLIISFAFIITIIIPNIKLKYIRKEIVISQTIQNLITYNETTLGFWIFVILILLSLLIFLIIENPQIRKHLKLIMISITSIINSTLILHFNKTRSLFEDDFLSFPTINMKLQHVYTLQEKVEYIIQICQQNKISLSETIIQNLALQNAPLSEMPNLIKEAANASLFPSKGTWWTIISWIPATCNVIVFCENHWKITLTTIIASVSLITILVIYSLQKTPNHPLPTADGTYNPYIESIQTIAFFDVMYILIAIIIILLLAYWVYANRKQVRAKIQSWKQTVNALLQTKKTNYENKKKK